MSNQHTGGVSRLPILGMVVLSLLVWLVGPARSVPLPAPTPLTPSAVAVVDQPVFTWTAVPGADHYDVQVSLDDDFATLSDPLGGGEVVVFGTTYIPTFSYGAKTHFWRVRAVADNGSAGSWSGASEFTRRWTNDDKPAGTASAVPASRVENLRLIGANPAPPANQVGFTWDPVPGAALYEVQISLSENFNSADDTVTMKCTTPHTTLTPYLSGEYSGREAVDTGCNTMLPLLSATTYYVRVRAVDMPTDPDYPEASEAKPVYGLWSDQRRETAEAVPDPLTVTPSANAGSGSIGQAATPLSGTGTHPDIPLLTWEPTPAAASYRVVIALDRDFTNRVATYATNTAALMPGEVYDEVNAGQAYHWFAIPCTQSDPIADCDTAERAAINHPSKVATFGRRSIATTGLSTTSTDAGRHAVLRWNDALTAAEAADTGYATGGVSRYEVEVTLGDWAEAKAFETDNLAWATTREPLAGGNYRWRVRGLDGQDVSMKWAYGSDFTIAAPGAAPVPTDPPGPGTPADPSSPADPGTTPEYQAPPPEDGSAKSVPPAKPGKPKVKAVNDRTVKVQWRRSTELGVPVSKYLLYRSKDGNRFVRVRRTQAAQTRILVTPGTVYWFRVVADSSAGSSKPSRPTKFRMPGA